MKKPVFNFRTVVAIVAIAVMGAVATSCSNDDGMFSDLGLTSDATNGEDLQMKALGVSPENSKRAALIPGTNYTSVFKRHYGGDYPNYVSYQFDFSTAQLLSSITPTVTSDSSPLSVGGMLTFFNQKAFKSNGSAKGCPGFVVGSDYEVARYTGGIGVSVLENLQESDVTSLSYSSEGSYTLPFLTSTHPASYFSAYGLKQSSAYAYYDANLLIGRQYHIECGGSYTTPIWVITDGYEYWAFCVDPYKNASSGSQKQWSTFNYKKLN